MKIMVLTQDLRGGGGAEKVIANLTLAFSSTIDCVLVFPRMTVHGDHEFAYRGQAVPVELRWNDETRGWLRKLGKVSARVQTFRRVIAEHHPDLILSNLSFVWHHLIAFLKLFRLTTTTVILRFANPPSAETSLRGKWYIRLARLDVRCVDHIIANSQGTARDLVQTLGAPADKITVIHNPIDLSAIAALAAEEVSETVCTDTRPFILSVGRLMPQKNPALLVRAFRRVRDRLPARLVFVGSGQLEADLRQLARSLGVEDDVAFLGWQKNPFKYMRRAGVFVLSSDYEGFGNVVVEAMACGCPVVATDCPGGPAEILAQGVYGRLVPVGDEFALAEHIVQVLQEESLRQDLAAKGRQRAQDFAMEVIARRYEQLFETVIASAGTPQHARSALQP